MKELKKILIISYYFPPCNQTPSERVFSWAKYFKNYGYYPIIVTRNWDLDIIDHKDEYIAVGKKTKIEMYEDFEIHYTPYKPTLKNNLFAKLSNKKLYFVYLIVSFFYSFFENFTSYFTPYKNLYLESKKVINQNDIKAILISGSPFHLFKFGYLLNKKFKIPWFADYRDDWNTNEIFLSNGLAKRLVQKISLSFEKKWVNSAVFFVTVSEHYVSKIEKILKIKGYEIINGFMPENYSYLKFENNLNFSITYVGSLYETQPIQIFVKSVINLIKSKGNLKIVINFIGLKMQDAQMLRLSKLIVDYEQYFLFTNRVSKLKAIEFQSKSNLLLICAHNNIKGTPGSKLYEYIALKKPVLICPSDADIIEETLNETGQSIICNTELECERALFSAYKYWETNLNLNNFKDVNVEICDSFSRQNQSNKLISLIDSKLGI